MIATQSGTILGPRTVADAIIRTPALHPPTITLAQAREALRNPHRHLLLLVSTDRVLLGTVTREDVDDLSLPPDAPALAVARLGDRVVPSHARLADVRADLETTRERRRAVVDADGVLLGLLCLKARRTGFCTDAGVAARASSTSGRHTKWWL